MSLSARRAQPAGLKARTPPRLPPLQQAVALVADDLAAAEAALERSLQSVVPAVSEIAGYLVAAGGKRLRPLITALGARAVGFDGDLVPLMCAGEILHLGSLLHDDVVDGGLERRGREAAHRYDAVWNPPGAKLLFDHRDEFHYMAVRDGRIMLVEEKLD